MGDNFVKDHFGWVLAVIILAFMAGIVIGTEYGGRGMVPESQVLASAGRPMSYADLLNGWYTVVSVINKDSGIAVVERELGGSLYFVTRIPVGMMEKQFKFYINDAPERR
jgi:hypothetical protein